MCAASHVICEIPVDCALTNPYYGESVGVNCGDCYRPQSDSRKVTPELFPFLPKANCNCKYDCEDYSRCCYHQPSRSRNTFDRFTPPLESEIVPYAENYIDCFWPDSALNSNDIFDFKLNNENSKQNVSSKPANNCLSFRDPLIERKAKHHECCAPKKVNCRRAQNTGIWNVGDPMTRCTLNNLSYMSNVCPNHIPKTIIEGCVPEERSTKQKPNYLPICISADKPWTREVCCCTPKYDNISITYNFNYTPNCHAHSN